MIITAGILLFLGLLILYSWVHLQYRNLIKKLVDLPKLPYALVLGAGLENDGSPTDILSDRVLSAVKLVESGKASNLIMSGTSYGEGYDEVTAMAKLAIRSGIDQEMIIMDKSGISTFDSMISFKDNYQKEIFVIVTQSFHLPRALWLAKQIGLNCYGIPANLYRFSFIKKIFWSVREFFALPFNLLKLIKYQYQRKNRPI
ncbi:MAG: hypothetical protein FJZ98_02215 [Chloroflexi bacterium]|nr:hypothetical protein [Chloroflexota bacterium]